MLSSLLKGFFSAIGNALLGWLARSGVSPNQISWIGLLLVLSNCGLYLAHGNAFALGVGVSLSVAFDGLDGAIARRQGMQSRLGAYLDATIDRYQEIAIYFAIAWVNGWWIVAFLVITGSLLISYNKARAAMEISIDNKQWPDLLERPLRLSLLSGGLILDCVVPVPATLGGSLLYLMLIVLAVLTHFTALQRFFRASRLLSAEPE